MSDYEFERLKDQVKHQYKLIRQLEFIVHSAKGTIEHNEEDAFSREDAMLVFEMCADMIELSTSTRSSC